MNDTCPKGAAIDIRGLSKGFGRTGVLRNLNLEVGWGRALTVLGPNGSGKTTLIKALATLTKPDSGTIHVAGLNLAQESQSVRRNIGVVTHDTLLYEGLTGEENLKFIARMFGLDRVKERIETAAEMIGVTDRLHQRIGTLSHGMKKRFSIARALLNDPLILLMDEPESGLDQEALTLLENVILDRTASFRTVVTTTHSLERGLALGNHMAILSSGRIAYQESLDSVEVSKIKDTYFRYTGRHR